MSLTSTPLIAASSIGGGAFCRMFHSCTSLVNVPKVLSTNITVDGYNGMFAQCSSLSSAPQLPATTLAKSCYAIMFEGCTSLTEPPQLPATQLAEGCYYGMFYYCTNLLKAPQLPATKLQPTCYKLMFNACYNLSSVPQILPATQLANGCYQSMFQNCKNNLTIAPQLPASSLVDNCYQYMFNGCKKLSSVIVGFNDWTPSSATSYWLYGVGNGGTFTKPSALSTIYDKDHIPVGWNIEIDPKQTPLTFETLEANNQIKIVKDSGTPTISAQYKINDGQWTDYTSFGTYINLSNIGDKISFRNLTTTFNSQYNCCYFSFTKTANVYGNIMSLVQGDRELNTITTIEHNYQFKSLFRNCYYLINAENLILPATTLSNYCYDSIFYSCINLIKSPKVLPAQNLVQYCYQSMFNGCSSLSTTPKLKGSTLANYCYYNMFNGCKSLISAPKLQVTTLANYCYYNMFSSCQNLSIPPELPAISAVNGCYRSMFKGCSALSSAPQLPATTLASRCYYDMFVNCKGLINTPYLPAETLYSECYTSMFNGCSKLNYVKANFKQWNTSYTNNWLYGVASGGNFFKSKDLTDTRGDSYIPSSWNALNFDQYLTFTTTDSKYRVVGFGYGRTAFDDQNIYQYSIDDGETWIEYQNPSKTAYNDCQLITIPLSGSVMFRGNGTSFSKSSQNYYIFRCGNYISLKGNINSLINFNDDLTPYCYYRAFQSGQKTVASISGLVLPSMNLATACYSYMFSSCKGLTTLSGLVLPATKIVNSCYNSMFIYCNNIQYVPQNLLHSTELAGSCYTLMFGWNKIKDTPKLPATTVYSSCYNSMFRGCQQLTGVTQLPASATNWYCYSGMFRDCKSLTDTPKLPATKLQQTCYQGMFDGCISLTGVTDLPALGILDQCYYSMFKNCTSLVHPPKMSGVVVRSRGCQQMFANCSSLIEAPQLPSTIQGTRNFMLMFNNCTSLSSVNVGFTEWNQNATSGWLNNVASAGVFNKLTALSTVYGENYIPSGWTVINTDAPKIAVLTTTNSTLNGYAGQYEKIQSTVWQKTDSTAHYLTYLTTYGVNAWYCSTLQHDVDTTPMNAIYAQSSDTSAPFNSDGSSLTWNDSGQTTVVQQ